MDILLIGAPGAGKGTQAEKLAPLLTSRHIASPEGAYTEFIHAPFPYYQQFLTNAETATRQGLESFQKAIENFQKAAEQGRENFEMANGLRCFHSC